MFTGLIQDIGTVTAVTHRGRSSRITVKTKLDLSDGEMGESIAVNGACFTVVEFSDHQFAVDVSPESLDRTSAGQLKTGSGVHLERALRLSDRLGGHMVLGHVVGLGELLAKTEEANATHLSFSAPPEVSPFLIPKGSVAVDGVSLTVNSCDDTTFSVTIIPHTVERTLLTTLRVGDHVNLEADVIGKYVARLLGPRSAQSDESLVASLKAAGFMKDQQ